MISPKTEEKQTNKNGFLCRHQLFPAFILASRLWLVPHAHQYRNHRFTADRSLSHQLFKITHLNFQSRRSQRDTIARLFVFVGVFFSAAIQSNSLSHQGTLSASITLFALPHSVGWLFGWKSTEKYPKCGTFASGWGMRNDASKSLTCHRRARTASNPKRTAANYDDKRRTRFVSR